MGLSQSGSGLLKLQGNIIQPGTTTAARSLSLTGFSTNGTGEIASNLGDMNGFPLGIQKDGSGTWTLSGTNSFSGPVKIQGNGSTLRFASPEALPAVANLEGTGSSGTYTFEMVASSPNYRMNAMSAFIMTFKSTNGPSTLTFTNTTTGNIVGGTSARAMTALTNARVVFEGPWDLNTSGAGFSRALTFNGDGTFVFNGSLNGSTLGTNSLIKASNGIAYLNASNNYNGGTQVQGGTLVVNHANAIPSVGFVTVSNNAILRVTAVVTNTISNPIVNSGTVQIASGGSMLASQITGEQLNWGIFF